MLQIFNRTETIKPRPTDALPVPTRDSTGAGLVCFRVSPEKIDLIAEKLNKAGVSIESDFRWPNGA